MLEASCKAPSVSRFSGKRAGRHSSMLDSVISISHFSYDPLPVSRLVRCVALVLCKRNGLLSLAVHLSVLKRVCLVTHTC